MTYGILVNRPNGEQHALNLPDGDVKFSYSWSSKRGPTWSVELVNPGEIGQDIFDWHSNAVGSSETLTIQVVDNDVPETILDANLGATCSGGSTSPSNPDWEPGMGPHDVHPPSAGITLEFNIREPSVSSHWDDRPAYAMN